MTAALVPVMMDGREIGRVIRGSTYDAEAGADALEGCYTRAPVPSPILYRLVLGAIARALLGRSEAEPSDDLLEDQILAAYAHRVQAWHGRLEALYRAANEATPNLAPIVVQKRRGDG